MSNDLEQQLTAIVEATSATDEAVQVDRGILHVQLLNGPLSIQLKEAIGNFANVLIKNAYKAGYKAGHAAALQNAPTTPPARRNGVRGLFQRH